jgi:ABC-type nickel/cobalt efflux system permease component RcnA
MKAWFVPVGVMAVVWTIFFGLAIFGPHRGPDDAAALAVVFTFAAIATLAAWVLWLFWKLLRFLVG